MVLLVPAVVLGVPLLVFAAEQTGGTPVDLIQFGVLGIIVALILFGWLWAKPAVDELKDRLTKAESQRDVLIDAYQDEILPALREANAAMGKMATVIETNSVLLAEVKAFLATRGAG